MTNSLACGRTFSLLSSPQVPQHLQEHLENVATRARQGCGINHKLYTFAMDVPVTEADLKRWSSHFEQTAPPPTAQNAVFIGGGFLDAEALLAMNDKAERHRAVHKLAPMKLLDFQQVVRMPMTKILNYQRKWLPYRQRLPVYQCRGPILDALLNTQVLALVAPPGSGRTLQLPQIILSNGSFNSKRLIVVCPTSLVACRTAARLREERGDDAASATVAVCTSTQYDVTEGTLLVVTTPEMLARQLLCDPLLLNVSCVILNDVHIRSPITELCMSFLRNILHLLKEEHNLEKRGGSLRVIVDCFEDAVATTVSKFFGDDCTTQLNLQHVLEQDPTVSGIRASQIGGMWSSPSVLHLEETIQWLEKCEKEGSFLCRDPVEDLRTYVENIGVQAKILAAGDAEFTNEDKLRSYWCPVILRAVQEYHLAERQESAVNRQQQKQQSRQPSIVVVVPNTHTASVVMETLQNLSDNFATSEETVSTSTFEVHVLLDSASLEEVDSVLGCGDSARMEGRRLVVIATVNVAQLVLPSTLEIGLVVDCARRSCASYDENTDTDIILTTYSLTQELLYRRSIARLPRGSYEGDGDDARAPVCTVVQLIPKSILYGNQRRRVRGDFFYHSIFGMSWDGYLELYHLLQAYEESIRCRGASVYSSGTEGNNSLSMTIGRIVCSNFIDVPAPSSSRYEKLRRIFMAVERHLQRLGHLDNVNNDSIPRLSPLGVAATCFSWPLSVVRLLLLSRLEDCVLPASVVGAIWMVGDMFSAGESDDETKQLMKEARVFFSRDSGSDTVSAFNAYCMWLSSREVSVEKEDEFVSESHIPKRFLMRIEAQQMALLRVLEVTRVFQASFELRDLGHNNCGGTLLISTKSSSPTSAANLVASYILEMQDDVLLDGNSLLRCITAAAYPQCGVLHNDGTVSSISFSDNAAEATVDASGGVASRTSLQIAVFSDNSVLSVKEMYQKYAERPFLYLGRSHIVDKGFSVLEEAIPLCMDGTVIACGEWRDWPKLSATRCRGWTSVLTNAWRQTKRARRLPPPAQLPAVSIPLKLYDTIQSTHVIVQADDTFFFTMRSTTAKWLQQMREQCRQRLWALLCDKSLSPSDAASLGLQDAWEWWSRRARNAQGWLRDRRASLTTTTSVNAKDSEASLHPYYHYSANPGRPEAVVLSNRYTGLSTTTSFFPAAANSAASAVAPDAVVGQSAAYHGKLPDPVTDKNILEMARSIGKAGTREQETNFLKAYPSLFGFLHPEHEFHGYYLHVLRREAPDMEVLGDNLEELEKFLMQIEEEVRCEIGMMATDVEASYEEQTYTAPAAVPSETNEQQSNSMYQFQNVNADEFKASYGMQIETAAEYAMRPPVLFKTHDAQSSGTLVSDGAGKATAQAVAEEKASVASFFAQGAASDNTTNSNDLYKTVAEPLTVKEFPVDSNVSIGNFTFERGSHTGMPAFSGTEANDSSNGGANGLTLKERLLAMSGGASLPMNQTTALLPSDEQQDPESSLQPSTSHMLSTMTAGERPTSTTTSYSLEANSMVPPSFVGSAAAAGTPFQQTPPMALNPAELLALMGPNPPVVAVNPLTIPPPPLPAEVLANRPPSIAVYPLPPRDFGNIPLILAKALGETMGVKVGPTLIVGDIARIDVPNHKVEARALGLKSFMCVGKKVYIFKNDRIVDPIRPVGCYSNVMKGRGREDPLQDLHNLEYISEKRDDDDRRDNVGLLPHESNNVGDHATLPYHRYMQYEQQEQQPPMDTPLPVKKSGHPPQIGLLTDSEDEEESSSDEESS